MKLGHSTAVMQGASYSYSWKILKLLNFIARAFWSRAVEFRQPIVIGTEFESVKPIVCSFKTYHSVLECYGGILIPCSIDLSS